mgnify:CR=1 FL=1
MGSWSGWMWIGRLNKVKQSLFKPESPISGAFCVFKQLNNKKTKRLDRKEQNGKKLKS